jgi:hypothetical protein
MLLTAKQALSVRLGGVSGANLPILITYTPLNEGVTTVMTTVTDTTAVVLIAGSRSGNLEVGYISLRNNSAGVVSVTFRVTDGSLPYDFISVSLGIGYLLEYDGVWKVKDANGGDVVSGSAITFPITGVQGGTGITSYILGDTLYGSGVNTLAKLAGNTTSGIKYLSQTGTGAVSAAPAWVTISAVTKTSFTPAVEPYTETATSGFKYIFCDATVTSTVLLPTAVGNDSVLTIVKTDAGGSKVDVTADGAETISGAAVQSINSQYNAITIVSDNVNWYMV